MYPRNAASPERISVGAVITIADGSVVTSGASVSVIPQGGSAGAGGGTTSYENGIVCYVPTQAETNYTSFMVVAYKASCIPVATTIITSASDTPGYAGIDWSKVSAPTTTLALTNTTIATTQKVDVETIKTNPVVNAGTVTFPTTATLASTTNITAGVITTTTNVTNEAAKYMHGAVWIDTVNGAAGTTSYTNGIATNPSSAIANAKTIADNLKLKRFWVQSGSSVTLAAAHVGYVFTGAGYILALGGQDISKAIIENVETLSGTGICTTGEAIIRNCHLGPTAITIGEVDFHDCHLMGTVTMSQAAVPYLFNKCIGVSSPKIVFAAANQTAVISKWSGPLTIAGMVSTNTLYLDGDGDVTFDNTNNTGTVYINGAIRLTDSGTSMAITDTSRWGEDQTIAVATTVAANGITATSIAADAINAAAVKADAVTKIQAGLATPTNITAGTITTVTNLTNAPTNGDLTATMKTSVTTAATAATPTISTLGANTITAASMNADASTEIATTLLGTAVDGTTTVAESMRLANSALGGKASGLATTTAVYRDLADTKDRISATVDVDGNRTAVTRTLT
jgi:hypothetical protein